MYGVREIDIIINNAGISTTIILFLENKIAIVNNKKIKISNIKIEDLFKIIRKWKNDDSYNRFIDEESYMIKIITDSNIEIIRGAASSNNNYNEFKNWVGDLYA